MPVVRTYERQVSPTAAPSVSRQEFRIGHVEATPGPVTKSAESYGAGLGDAIAKIGEDLYAHQQQRQDQVRLLDASNQAGELENQLMYDPKTGALNVRGKAALALPDQVGKSWDDQMGKVRAGLANDRQRLQFDQYNTQKRQQIMQRLNGHVAQQSYAVETDALNGLAENETQASIGDAYNPTRAEQGVETIRSAYQEHADHYGVPPEQTDAAIAKATSRIREGVIQRYLDNNDDIRATTYYQEHQDQILGERRGVIEKQLEVSSTEGQAMRSAQTIFQKYAPKADTDPIEIDKMASEARSTFANNPKLAKATIDQLKEMTAERNAGQAERASANKATVWSTLAEKGDKMTVAELTAMPQYRAMPGPEQEQARLHILDRGEHLNQLDRANQQWDWAQQSHKWSVQEHARTASQQRDEDQAKANWAAYWDYSQPDKLDKMSENDIMGLTPKLGRTIVNELMKGKRSLTKTDDKAEGTVGHFDDGLFRELAGQAGLDSYSPSSDEEKAQLGQLHNRLNMLIGDEEKGKKRKLSLDEQRKIGQDEVDRKVTVPGALSGLFGSTTIPAAIVKPDDRDQAYVPMKSVPKDYVTQAINHIRSAGLSKGDSIAFGNLGVSGNPSDDDMKLLMQHRIERAYALRLMGASRQEIDAALMGKK